MCNWDEDPVTMAVEAVRDMRVADDIDVLMMASTTAPFADRQNAGIIAEALNIAGNLRTMDIGGSQRAGTSALMSGLDSAAAGNTVVVAAAEQRKTRAGSPMEMLTGDGAAAIQLGGGEEIATLKGAATVSTDFIDHFRASGDDYDYDWVLCVLIIGENTKKAVEWWYSRPPGCRIR